MNREQKLQIALAEYFGYEPNFRILDDSEGEGIIDAECEKVPELPALLARLLQEKFHIILK